MRPIRAVWLAIWLAMTPVRAIAQAIRISAPTGDYLLRVTQEWAAASPLGSLTTRTMAPDDVELRVWGGYGLTGTSGAILRQAAGRWHAWRARVVRCTLQVGTPIGDTASAATESVFVARARHDCGASIGDTHLGGRIYESDTLALEPVSASNADRTWKQVIAAGALRLPPSIPRKWLMVDGFTYVIEIRRGDKYRASVIEALEAPEVAADSIARIVYLTAMRSVQVGGSSNR